MTIDEVRTDPHAWAFVRRHHQVRPRIVRARRVLLGIQMMFGALVIVVLTMFGVSLLSAGPSAATTVVDGADGVFEIAISPEAGSDQIVEEIRSMLDERGLDVRVETITGRDAVVGRLLGAWVSIR